MYKYNLQWMHVRAIKRLLVVLCCLVITQAINADNLGVRGEVYKIVEPDMLMGIHKKLEAMKESGELERQKKAFIHRAVAHVLRPPPVKGVSDLNKGQKASHHFFDPTLVVKKDIKNLSGDLIAAEGTLVNPLRKIHFKETLYFINADNKDQLSWVDKQAKKLDESGYRYKIILVKGNIKTSSKFLNHRIYFDQYGRLCKRLKIRHTPVRVYQPRFNGFWVPRLLVQEVSLG